MDCPRCKKPLTARTRDSVEVDICSTCHGMWLDGGELGKILETERERRDAEARQNWRLYDRGRDSFDAAPAPGLEKSALESLLAQE